MLASARSPETIRLRLYYLSRWQRSCPRPQAATREAIIAWLSHPGWGQETRRSARTAMVTFYRWMHEEGHLPPGPDGTTVNPAARLPKITVPRGVARPATDEAIQRGLNDATVRVKRMILLGSLGGLRRGEISRVHTGDLTGRDLIVHGKGGHRRLIRLDPSLAASIASAPAGWLFPAPDGHRMTPAHIGVLISRALPKGTTPHMLRHACGTWLNDNGVPLTDIRDWLGHADVSTTQRYVQVRLDRAAAATEQAATRFVA
jgi:integrase